MSKFDDGMKVNVLTVNNRSQGVKGVVVTAETLLQLNQQIREMNPEAARGAGYIVELLEEFYRGIK